MLHAVNSFTVMHHTGQKSSCVTELQCLILFVQTNNYDNSTKVSDNIGLYVICL